MPIESSVEQSKNIVRRLVEETINPGNIAAFDDLYDPHFVNHEMTSGPGVEALKQHYFTLRAAFPDYSETIDSIIVRGDMLVVRTTMYGTHQGKWRGISPTGRPVKTIHIRIFRIVDGKITERWGSTEPVGLMQQLGAIPPLIYSQGAQHRPNRTPADTRYF